MKKLLLTVLCCTAVIYAFAADGYKIRISFTDLKDTTLYLANYYGKPLPTIFRADSTRVDHNGNAVFQQQKKIAGGIYLIMVPNSESYFELLLQNGDDIAINASLKALPGSVTFKNSSENQRFSQYTAVLKKYTDAQNALAQAKTTLEKEKANAAVSEAAQAVLTFRSNTVAQYPGSLMANVFRGMERPHVPEGKHYIPGTKVEDTAFAYNYYKAHFWDKFDLTDERLVYTPLFDSKLDVYFNQIVPPYADSMKKEADWLLARTRGHGELFKYSLWWLTQNAQHSKIMGMDEAFVYLVENYFMKGDAAWVTPEILAQYIERARSIAPNVIGNPAPELKMVDLQQKEHSLRGLDARYTLLIFWSPECSGCRAMMPKIDSLYRAGLKEKGMKIYAVRTDGDEKDWANYIQTNKLNDWIHVYDPKHKTNYRADYDVYGTPMIYLLDEQKTIKGKKLDHTNIAQVVKMVENEAIKNKK